MQRAGPAFKPFASRGRRPLVAILVTFVVFSAVSVGLSIWSTSRSQYKASVLEVAARQRTLTERYLREVLLAQEGVKADPHYLGSLLAASASASLDEIVECWEVSGAVDYLARFVCADIAAYEEVTRELIDDEGLGIAKIVSHVALRPIRRFAGYPESLLATNANKLPKG